MNGNALSFKANINLLTFFITMIYYINVFLFLLCYKNYSDYYKILTDTDMIKIRFCCILQNLQYEIVYLLINKSLKLNFYYFCGMAAFCITRN